MKKCSKDPEGKKWHKSNAEAIVCGCLAPKSEIVKAELKVKRAMPAGLRKYLDDKTAAKSVATPPISEAGTGLPASAAEPQKPEQEQEKQPEQEKKKSWVLEICIAIIVMLVAGFWIFHYFLIPPKQDEGEKKDE